MPKNWLRLLPRALLFLVGAFVFTYLIGLFLYEVLRTIVFPVFEVGSTDELINLGLAVISFVIAGFWYYLIAKDLSQRKLLYEQLLLFFAFLLLLMLGLGALDNLLVQRNPFSQSLGLTAVSVLVFALLYKRFLRSHPAPTGPTLTKTKKAQILVIAAAILISSFDYIDTNKDNISRALKTIEEEREKERQERIAEQALIVPAVQVVPVASKTKQKGVIAYWDKNKIFVMDFSWTEPKIVDEGHVRLVGFAPDGETLVYIKDGSQIMRRELVKSDDGSGKENLILGDGDLIHTEEDWIWWATFITNGEKTALLYRTLSADERESSLKAYDFERNRLLPLPDIYGTYYSVDEDTLVYVKWDSIGLINLNGSVRKLFGFKNDVFTESEEAWLPKVHFNRQKTKMYTSIAPKGYIFRASGEWKLWEIDLRHGPRFLGSLPSEEWVTIVWSNDGEKIAYFKNEDLFIADNDGSEERPVPIVKDATIFTLPENYNIIFDEYLVDFDKEEAVKLPHEILSYRISYGNDYVEDVKRSLSPNGMSYLSYSLEEETLYLVTNNLQDRLPLLINFDPQGYGDYSRYDIYWRE